MLEWSPQNRNVQLLTEYPIVLGDEVPSKKLFTFYVISQISGADYLYEVPLPCGRPCKLYEHITAFKLDENF